MLCIGKCTDKNIFIAIFINIRNCYTRFICIYCW